MRQTDWCLCVLSGSLKWRMSPSQKKVSSFYQWLNSGDSGVPNCENDISIWTFVIRHLSRPLPCVFSERPYAHSDWPGEAADERAFQPVQRSGGRLRAGPRGEDHHLHWPAGILGYGLLPGERHEHETGKTQKNNCNVFIWAILYFLPSFR